MNSTAHIASRLAATPVPASTPVGWWSPSAGQRARILDAAAMREALGDLRRPLYVLKHNDAMEFVQGDGGNGVATFGTKYPGVDARPILAFAPAVRLSQLGDPSFCADHGVRYPYMMGAMANGIASAELVIAAARAGVLGSFGAAGLRIAKIEEAIQRLVETLGDLPYCFNLIHSPNEPAHEMAVVQLYLRRKIRLVEAAAYLDLTLPAVLYRVHGLHRNAGPGGGEVGRSSRPIASSPKFRARKSQPNGSARPRKKCWRNCSAPDTSRKWKRRSRHKFPWRKISPPKRTPRGIPTTVRL